MRYILFCLVAGFLGCSNKRHHCENYLTKSFNVSICKMEVSIPDNCYIVDTVIYGNSNTLKNYLLKNEDSSITINAFIERIDGYPDSRKLIKKQRLEQKSSISFLFKNFKIIDDKLTKVNGTDVGYLKFYVETIDSNVPFILSKIFFYKDGKLIDLSIKELYKNEMQFQFSNSDCIFSSIELY